MLDYIETPTGTISTNKNLYFTKKKNHQEGKTQFGEHYTASATASFIAPLPPILIFPSPLR